MPIVDLEPPQIELHRWDAGQVDLLPYAKQIQWSWSVNPPWHMIKLKLAIPRRAWLDLMPKPGDWLIIRHGHDALAEGFGYVVDRGAGVRVVEGGHVKTDMTTITAIGWWDLYGKQQTYVAPGLDTRDRGTIMSLAQWFGENGPWTTLLRAFDSSIKVGDTFAWLARILGKIRLPPTISKQSIGTATRFAYDSATRKVFCSGRPLSPILGPTLSGFQAGLVTNTTVLDLLMTTFLGDRNMVEIFPSLEYVQNTRQMSKTGRVLGKQPVVIYRMKPYATKALSRYAKESSERNKEGKTPFNSDAFQDTAWKSRKSLRIPQTSITGLTIQQLDDDHVNAVTVGLPMQQDSVTRFMDSVGLPLYAAKAIRQRGVRLFQPMWPFFPPAKSKQQDLVKHTKAVAGRAWQFMAGGDRFERGQLTTQYIRALTHGAIIDAEIPSEIPGNDVASLIAYAERITHTWSVQPDSSWMARSTTDFSRGLFNETARDPEFPEPRAIATDVSDPIIKKNPRGRKPTQLVEARVQGLDAGQGPQDVPVTIDNARPTGFDYDPGGGGGGGGT